MARVTDEQRKLLTWTLNAGNKNYEDDLEKYGNKIYALGVHEFQVEYDGEIYIRRAIPSFYDGTNYGTYRYGANNDVFIDNAVPEKNPDGRAWMGWNFWKSIEKGMRRWPHIRQYPSFILFGSSRVVRMLDSTTYQDAFIDNCEKVIDNLMNAYNHPDSNQPYIKGIEIDFEASMSSSIYSGRTGDNVKYMNILKRIKNDICIPRGLVLQVNAYAMWGKDTPFYYRFHDYELFAKTADKDGNSVIDELQIMTYDFAWNGSAPGPSTPLWWFDEVSAWALKCFGASDAKLKINNVFFGSAGYGHRWGIYDYDSMYGSTITYRMFVDWQNGLYKHFTDPGSQYDYVIYHDQEYLNFAGIEDPESKNQILQQHVYDYFKARYGNVSLVNGGKTATIAQYNGLEYLTTYSRLQKSIFTNIVAESFAPSSIVGQDKQKVKPYKFIEDTPITINEGGNVRTKEGITGYQIYGSSYAPTVIEGQGAVCQLVPEGRIEYKVNVPTAGDYKLIALTSFTWYDQARIRGSLNGQSIDIKPFADYYPLMFKASHWFDCGSFSFNAGDNTIQLNGDPSDNGTIIYGFIVCQGFQNNFRGGDATFKATIKPFKKKDGTYANIPADLAVTSKALRQDPEPLMMWEDRFAQYRRFVENGQVIYRDVADITNSTTYYTKYEERVDKRGTGSTLSSDQTYCYDPAKPKYEIGYSWGTWPIKADMWNGEDESAYAYWNNMSGGGRLLVNYNFQSNMQIETEVRVTQAGTVGIQFGGSTGTNGYLFLADYANRKLKLMLDNTLIAEEPLPSNYELGNRTKLRAIVHNGKGHFYIGYSDIKAFNARTFDLSDVRGGVAGLYAQSVEARFYMLKISTTDKWNLMEKFTVQATIQGETYSNTFGAIERLPEYTINNDYGYLNYSGIDELETRVLVPTDPNDPESEFTREDVSLDYEFFITEVPGSEGTADIKVLFDDPGVWYAHLYVVDKQGGSVTWCGDAQSFLDSMNRAVNDVGAKGIGLWAMGQEEPKVFETIPEVVPYHD